MTLRKRIRQWFMKLRGYPELPAEWCEQDPEAARAFKLVCENLRKQELEHLKTMLRSARGN